MKRFTNCVLVLLACMPIGYASAITKSEVRKQYQTTNVAPKIIEFTSFMESPPLVHGSDLEQVKAEKKWIADYDTQWQNYCRATRYFAENHLNQFALSRPDRLAWEASIRARSTACDDWTGVVHSVFYKYDSYELSKKTKTFTALKKELKGGVAESAAEVFESFLASGAPLDALSEDWTVAE